MTQPRPTPRTMKKVAFSILLSLCGLTAGLSQPSPLYRNDGIVNVPPQIAPQINATNFVNNGVFNINFTGTATFRGLGVLQLYTTSNTRNYTNRGAMSANTGFKFDLFAQNGNSNGT